MSTNIKILQDQDNNIFYPKTHTQAIIDNNSTTLEDRLEGIEGNILPSGGINGQILEKDNTQSTGAKWADRTQISVGTTTTGESGTNANVTNSGTATNPVLNFTIPRGTNGHNPCLGRFTSEPNPMPDGQIGDYLYIDITTVDQTTQEETTTTTVYHYGSNGWDNGTVIDAEHPTLASGQDVTAVHIKDLNGDDDTNTQGVLGAEQGKKLGLKLRRATITETQVSPITDYIPEGETNSGFYKLVNEVPTWQNIESGSLKSTKIALPSNSSYVKFLGYTKSLSQYNGLYLFLDNNNNIIKYYSYHNEGETGLAQKQILVEVPSNAAYFVCEYHVWGGIEFYQCFKNTDFYCYTQSGYEAANVKDLEGVLRGSDELFLDNSVIYANDFSEIYICAELTNAVEHISIKQVNNSLYFRALPSLFPFTCALPLTAKENGVAYELHVTTSGDSVNYPVGKLIGLIVFKDITHFSDNSTTSDTQFIDIQRAKKLYLQPIISAYISENAFITTNTKIADGAVTNTKIADFTIEDNKLKEKYINLVDNYDLRGLFKELYIFQDAISNPYTELSIKVYETTLYVRPRKQESAVFGWQVQENLTELVDNVVYPLTVKASGGNSNYPIGTLVGYVIFKDVATLRTKSLGGVPKNGINANITNITESPIINTYINTNGLNATSYPEIQLPSDIYIVSGDELRIYYRSILKTANPENYCVKVIGAGQVGKPYPRYYWFKSDAVGTYQVEFGVYDNDDVKVKSASTTIHVVSSMLSPSANKNVLVFGASATASGYIAGELRRRLTGVSGYCKIISNTQWISANTGDTYTINGITVTLLANSNYVRIIEVSAEDALNIPDSGTLIRQTGSGSEEINYYKKESISLNPIGLGLNNINFIGRKTGTVINVPQEATGGWSWVDYSGEGRPAYRFYLEGFEGQLNIGQTYTQGNLIFTIAEINIDAGTGDGNIRCLYEGSGTPSTSGTLTITAGGSGAQTITYTSRVNETYNPFYNNGALDFANYLTQYCDGATSIDVMISHCGMNNIGGYTVDTMGDLFNDYIKPFIRAYKTYCTNNSIDGKFIFSTLPLPSPTGGMAANYGSSQTWNYQTIALRLYKFAELAREMAAESEFNGFVYVADDIPVFDAENSYPAEDAYVNTRSAITEKRGTNGVHPIEGGSYQVSDAIYAVFNTLTWE